MGVALSGIAFLDLQSGKLEFVSAPSDTATIVAVSPKARRVAFLDSASNATDLVVGEPGRPNHTILEINSYLKDRVGGTPVRIDHKGPAGDARISWLLLQPGYRKGDRLPTIVNACPGEYFNAHYSMARLNWVEALNDNVLVAQGYAVLYASMPLHFEDVPRDPMKGLADDVLSATDAAIAAGYVDPHRLAIQGHSFGGFTALSVIS